MPLTHFQIQAAKPKAKPYKMFDGHGLYLEIAVSGRKSWKLKYRYRGKERHYPIGIYPEISLQLARLEKEQLKGQLESGHDPRVLNNNRLLAQQYSSEHTFEVVAREWHEINKPLWNPRYSQTLIHRLEKYVLPSIGDDPIDALTPIRILACLQKIDKTAPDMARRIKQIISHICRYAIATGRINSDLTTGLEAALRKYKKTHFAAVSVEELPDLLKTIHDQKGRFYRQTYLAIQLMLLTFVRTSELIETRWEEIDFERAVWIIPAERMKMRSEHIVPLARQTLEIFTELRQMNPYREHVFPSIPHPRKPMSKGTILVALKRMGYGKRMTGHGFRSLALGVLKEQLGYSHDVADRQLAHSPKSSTDRAYDRAKFIAQRTEMMQRYADYLDRVLLCQLQKALQTESDRQE